MKLREALLVATIGALPWCAWARDTAQPLETVALPAASTASTTDASLPDETIANTNPAPAPAASRPSAPAATAPKPETERRVRRQAERLDRPPYIRPM